MQPGTAALGGQSLTALPSVEEESGKSRLVSRFGLPTIIGEEPGPVPGPKEAKLCLGDEAIIIGVVDRKEPTAQASREWENLDLECVIVSVARQELQARERLDGPGRREEEWEEWAQHCGDESEYDSEEYSLDQGQREAGLDTMECPGPKCG